MNTPFTDVAAEHAVFNTKSRQKIQQTEFLMSAPTFRLCPPDMGLEVAFAGRSNAGKSSAINALTNQRQLARSSKTPGRTQMINFFSIGDNDRRLVDLPGYGYAAVPLEMKKEWQVELEEYLVSRSSLAGLVLMTDIRHPLKFFDEQMLRWANDGELPVHILLTKADKLKYGASKNALLNTRKRLKELGLNCSIQLFSALRKEGLDELAGIMGNWYEYQLEADKIIESSFALLEGEELEEAIEKDSAQQESTQQENK
ncbi:ribosome biogenesis GTP-binding protein YihA/YsxC [Psychrobacter sp. SWN149]|uniref:ribosome biogenesis GTP-binding protein YihA/YsxC n=1 Tax=Psychrobacter sp. SWN149 TaxID=2792057 RepID=UPI0018CF4D3B|nr:ribosome biogenesis GTP-binding protein YihA/YsxC [Psychrobacter sp. SWN149]MBH0005199.1 YihA family ribosome biogenesis GTP-binding protein [Psychrobacter sp. SWN149]